MTRYDPIPERPVFDVQATPSPGGGTLVVVSGELDMATAGVFERELRERLDAGPVRLDLSGLTFMDSSGVRVLDALVRVLERDEASWALVIAPELHESVRQILEMTGMIWVLPFEDGGGEEP